MNFPEMEEKVLDFWKENDVFQKSIDIREGAPKFVFFEGPPTANGMPHPGHVLTRAIKDVVLRYQTMCGKQIARKAGWDTHGLPVELEVEKSLGISGKPQIEEYGVEAFVKKCKESVFKYEQEWRKMTERLGFWVDLDDPYVTYHDNYIESVWWAVKTIYDKGLMYKGYKVVPYCPRCGTALSSHEVAQGYKDIKEPSIFVQFKVMDREDEYFLVWTTTPWTLPSNVALAVSEDADYAYVKADGKTFVLAKDLVEAVMGEEMEYSIDKVVKGRELLGIKYEPLFRFEEPEKEAWRVIAGDYVTLTDGTGIVHIAPAFGEDDMRVSRQNDLPIIQLVNTEGKFVESVTPWAGMFVKDADPKITAELKSRGMLFKVVQNEHSYPFCWRCDTPLLYYARSSWFIKMSEVRDKLLANNNTINWQPEHIRDGRFGNFLENVIDWAVSRERYWGTPLPLWVCEDCGHVHAIGSKEELRSLATDMPDQIELHRPYIDNVHIKCPECGGRATRVPEVMDCWFDSGSMPFAQWHYPFENKEKFEESFPADFISEAIDQTRGWFYTLLAISSLLFDKAPYKNCVVLGLVLDEKGLKMSKSKGNVVNTQQLFDRRGADATRWYLYTTNPPWNPTRFYEEGITEVMRKFLGTLWNVYSFYVLYANIDSFDPNMYHIDVEERPDIDRWLLSSLNTLCKEVRELMDKFDVTSAGRKIESFVDDLSNWYVRRCRKRYWAGDMTEDKVSAYLTLHETLVTIAKLIAPFVPFIAEEIYQNLVMSCADTAKERPCESVHLADYPACDDKLVDKDLERRMDLARKVVYLGRSARAAVNIKNRQPLGDIIVQVISAQQEKDLNDLSDLILEELNVKKLSVTKDISKYVSHIVKPRFDVLGPRYGAKMKEIAKSVAKADPEALWKSVLNEDSVTINLESGESLELSHDDLLIQTVEKEGFHVESDGPLACILDTEITEDLKMEGYARELVNKVQTMRKEAKFEIEDRIATSIEGDEDIRKVVDKYGRYLMDETLSVKLDFGKAVGESVREWDINGEKVTIGVERSN